MTGVQTCALPICYAQRFSGSGDIAYYHTVADKVFIPTQSMLKDFVIDRGNSIVTEPTASAVLNSTYVNGVLDSTKPWYYWVRYPRITSTHEMYHNDGVTIASDGVYGVRPLIYIDPIAFEVLSGIGKNQSPYVIKGNGTPARSTLDQTANFYGISSWAYRNVVLAHDKGLTLPEVMSNYNKPITRIDFARLIVRLYEFIQGEFVDEPSNTPFTDTADSEVIKAYNLGIVSGKGAGLFEPYATIKRQEMAVMFYNMMSTINPNIKNAKYNLTFSDHSNIPDWSKQAVAYMSNYKVISAVGENRFNPEGNATREQAISMVLTTSALYIE